MRSSTLLLRGSLLALALMLLGPALVGATSARAEDPPDKSKMRAGGEVEAQRLADGLLAEAPGPRALAEARLQQADVTTLRFLVSVLRRRLEVALRPGELSREAAEAPTGTRSVVTVRTWVVEATAERAQALVGAVPTGSDGLKRFAPAELEALLRALQTSEGLRPIASPVVSTYLGQKAALALEQQTAYVGDFELSERAGRKIAEPVVETVSHGLKLDVTPTPLGTALRLDIAVEQVELVKPLATWTGKLFEGTLEVSLQLPELKSTRWSRRVVVDPGVAVLLSGAGSEPGPGGKGLLVFVQARTP